MENTPIRIERSRWISASEKLPTIKDNGEKVLLYRIVNDQQSNMAISIHNTTLVKHCNPKETWWMEIPKPPLFIEEVEYEEGYDN